MPRTQYEQRQNLTGNYATLLGSRGGFSVFFNLAYSRPESAAISPFMYIQTMFHLLLAVLLAQDSNGSKWNKDKFHGGSKASEHMEKGLLF